VEHGLCGKAYIVQACQGKIERPERQTTGQAGKERTLCRKESQSRSADNQIAAHDNRGCRCGKVETGTGKCLSGLDAEGRVDLLHQQIALGHLRQRTGRIGNDLRGFPHPDRHPRKHLDQRKKDVMEKRFRVEYRQVMFIEPRLNVRGKFGVVPGGKTGAVKPVIDRVVMFVVDGVDKGRRLQEGEGEDRSEPDPDPAGHLEGGRRCG
jgi:hypothetical protein